MSIWSKPITSPEADEKVRSHARRTMFWLLSIVGLATWTWIVKSVHDYAYFMSAWSDGASVRGPDRWTPYVLLWAVPVLVVVIALLFVRAARQKKADRAGTDNVGAARRRV
ncbi:MAG TPA: hypothetical protein PLB90_12045 [Opitutaceae bacterium]|nr:hypothetical protein [Opitutaceae bacterium]